MNYILSVHRDEYLNEQEFRAMAECLFCHGDKTWPLSEKQLQDTLKLLDTNQVIVHCLVLILLESFSELSKLIKTRTIEASPTECRKYNQRRKATRKVTGTKSRGGKKFHFKDIPTYN